MKLTILIMIGTLIVLIRPMTIAQNFTPIVQTIDRIQRSGEPDPQDYPDEADKPDKKDDSGYKHYKAGYNFILEEQWEPARKEFIEVLKQNPKSEYADDAEYWSAYALMHTDKKKAAEAYKKFIKKYPSSSYYDDAVSDLNNLDGSISITATGDGDVVMSRSNSHSYSYAIAPTMRMADRQMRIAERQIQRQLGRIRTPKLPRAFAVLPRMSSEEEEIDRETRLKMDALSALGETKEDSMSFRTLSDVAVDRSQPRPLRETA